MPKRNRTNPGTGKPITLEGFNNSPLCEGYRWIIKNEEILIKYVARLIVGQYRHVSQLIKGVASIAPNISNDAIQEVIKKLGTPATDGLRWNRDGWVFQMISWVAARLSADSQTAIAPPHTQRSEKGVDNLMVHLHTSGTQLDSITIGEDKATINARNTITQEVWPELEEYETGKRDNELLCSVTALLERSVPGHVDQLIQNILWREKRGYRVSMTIEPSLDDDKSRNTLFKGYDKIVKGNCKRRRAETIALKNMRSWMDSFCKKLISELETMKKVKHV